MADLCSIIEGINNKMINIYLLYLYQDIFDKDQYDQCQKELKNRRKLTQMIKILFNIQDSLYYKIFTKQYL